MSGIKDLHSWFPLGSSGSPLFSMRTLVTLTGCLEEVYCSCSLLSGNNMDGNLNIALGDVLAIPVI